MTVKLMIKLINDLKEKLGGFFVKSLFYNMMTMPMPKRERADKPRIFQSRFRVNQEESH